MMKVRHLVEKDAEQFAQMLMRSDEQTKFMLFEPGERNVTQDDVIRTIKRRTDTKSLTLVAEANENIAGFLSADRGFAKRSSHCAFIVTGLLEKYRGMGLGTKLFEELNNWALSSDIKRLELTVMTHNEIAINLYKKVGFKIEGLKEKSLIVDGNYVDEYYMAKIL